MIPSIYLPASIVFLGAPLGVISVLVATGMLDILIVGFLLDRAEDARTIGRSLAGFLKR